MSNNVAYTLLSTPDAMCQLTTSGRSVDQRPCSIVLIDQGVAEMVELRLEPVGRSHAPAVLRMDWAMAKMLAEGIVKIAPKVKKRERSSK